MTLKRNILPPPSPPIRPDVSLFIVNIVLLLILFFLATGTLVNTPDQGVRLSETRDLPIDQVPSPALTVAPDGDLSLDGTSISEDMLAQALTDQSVLYLLIDKNAPAQDLLALINNSGLSALDIRLVTIHRRDGT